jgi:hypothetical protein
LPPIQCEQCFIACFSALRASLACFTVASPQFSC